MILNTCRARRSGLTFVLSSMVMAGAALAQTPPVQVPPTTQKPLAQAPPVQAPPPTQKPPVPVLPPAQKPPAPTPAPASTQTLPGGASQMQEVHGDWRVTCAQGTTGRVCSMSQQLADEKSRQLVVGIELQATSSDKATGSLIMPFGLSVDRPVTLTVDAGQPMSRSFKTCLPVGCIVSLDLDAGTLAGLRRGTALNVKGIASDTGKDAEFKMSLNGFGSALDRLATLSK